MSVSQIAGGVLDGIYKLKDDGGRNQWEVFHDLPSRELTHYYRVMRRPMSLSMIRKNLRKNSYPTLQDFVRDAAQIAQNAKAYNEASTVFWIDADAVERFIKARIPELREQYPKQAADLHYPNLAPVVRLDNGDDNGLDSSDASTGPRSSRRRRSTRHKSISDIADAAQSAALSSGGPGLKRERDDLDDEPHETEGRKKRGRPPTVDKPHEHRIKAILRAVRRVKTDDGRVLSTEFEKMPDSRQVPEYHELIERPLAIDSVRKTIKRRGYASVDDFLADMSLIFSNAKKFVGDESHPVWQDAEVLEQIMLQTAEEEKKKPDSAYADPDSNSKVARLPLDSVEHRGEDYRVGDWVHISNPNDPAKPTVGQIFRLWREGGKTWANCCWYYRPEQTVHKWDKLFWENEVVKSGQYRDHLVDDILEKCFVMFITKYQRGRPKEIGNRSVYLCESRYNEGEKTFNKIRTWKACIPDEIRNSDYPMDMFGKTRSLRRVYSPLRNELPADAKDTDPIPEPVMGDPMAPPLRGAVYKRPYDPEDPPEEPTPPSPPPQAARAASATPAGPLAGPGAVGPTAMTQMGPGIADPGAMAANSPRLSNPFPNSPQNLPMNRAPVFRGGPPGPPGAGPPQPPPFIPTAYVLPPQFVTSLEPDSLAAAAKLPDGQPLWFPSCPINVTHRVLAEPLPPSLRFDVDGETKRGSAQAHGFGHSAKYLAWKRSKLAAAR